MADLEEMEQREARVWRALVEGTTHLVGLIGADGRVEYLSASSKRLLRYLPEEAIGLSAFDLLHPDDLENAISVLAANAQSPADGLIGRDYLDTPSEWRVRHTDGHYVTPEVLSNNFFGNPDINAILIVGQNRSSRRLFESALVNLSKSGLSDDGYRIVLDVLDTSLISTTSLLYLDDDTPTFVVGARLGGDEFAAHLVDTSLEATTAVAHRIVALASVPVVVEGQSHRLRVSIGVDCSADVSLDEQIRRADRSLYLAKDRGGNTVARSDNS